MSRCCLVISTQMIKTTLNKAKALPQYLIILTFLFKTNLYPSLYLLFLGTNGLPYRLNIA